ncbi:DNRLRE domain-containing protein [Streptomyces cinerochromogenes]|uniref:DNRLRE domain-containing protein n=1 Tax=Streptomyces cinerochromogenes TaxID=66422 RepID=UPI0033B25F1F
MRRRHRPGSNRFLVYVAYAMAGVVTAGLALPAPRDAAEAVTPVATAAAASDDGDAATGEARRRAAASGERVEVTALRTESSTTYVNPDGSVTVEAATGPVRVKDDDGAWHDLDTTLVRRDGGIEPRQAAADIRISDGGEGPLAEVDEGDKTLGISWDGPLPEPEIRGNTAVYSEVRPGEDLVVTALPEGFSHQLVLKERPKDDVELRIPVAAEGLKLRETADERLLWESDSGRKVATAPVPVMWGAGEGRASGEPAKVTDVDVSVEGGTDGQTLVLKPDTSFLTDPAVTYPVTVDPTNTLLGPLTDTWIQDDDYPTSQRGSTELKAGTYNGTERARSYLKFDTARFLGKHIVDADLRLYSHWSSTCSTNNSGIQVRRVTSDWDPSAITWGSQPGTTTASAPVSTAAKGYSSACPAGQVSWDIDGIAQAWADGQPDYGVRLAAVDETDPLTWRRYRSANYVDGSHDAATEPSLIVTYNSAPAVPASLDVSPLKTGTTLTTAGSLTPTLQAKVGDADADSDLVTEFQVQPDPAFADTTYTWTGKTAQFAPGTVATTQIPTASAAPDGSHLRMRARTGDGIDTSAWSDWKTFRVDATAVQPADLPTQLQAGATDTASPLVTGVVTSPGGGMVEAQFRLGNATGTQTLGTQLVANGERAGFQIPADRLTSGGPFDWSMRACYAGKCSAWTERTPIAAGTGAEPDRVTATSSVDLPLTKATVCTDSDACVGETGTALKAGSVSGKNWRAYLKADVSKIPAGARVTKAQLTLQSAATTPDLDVHALNAAWATTGTGSQLDAVTAPEANLTAGAPWTIDITGLVTGWTDGANANNGLVLRRAEDAPSTAGISFTSAALTAEYEAATPPSPPMAVHARAADQGALVTWGASEDSGYNDTVLTYEVTALDSSGAEVAKHTTHGTDSVFTGLTNGASYTFRVSASSAYGTSGAVTSADVKPVGTPLDSTAYTQAVREYLDASASLTTGEKGSAAAAVDGRPHAGMYTSLLKAEESWLIDSRDSLKASGLTYTSITTGLSDALLLPSADGTVTVRTTVSQQKTLADAPSDPETTEATVLYTFSAGDTPVLRGRMNAEQYEQQLAKDDRALGAVTYGTVENDSGTTQATRTAGAAPSAYSSYAAQITPYATINASGTAKWARDHWNDRAQYSQDCTNFASKALYYGGGMRMKGVNKDKKSADNWWRVGHLAPHGVYYYTNSYTWTVADKMHTFLLRHSDGAINTETKQSYAKVGDIVLFNWGGKGGWDHAGVITKMSGGKAYVSAHNNNRLNQRLDVYINSQRGTWADIFHVIPGWY